jgi:uncharacterized protein (TIGR03435 family)
MAALLLAGAMAAWAQVQPSRLAFEVATIKRNLSLNEGGSIFIDPGGRFRVVNVPVSSLISQAYGEQSMAYLLQVVGGPDWLTAEKYDIIAKVSADLASLSVKDLVPKRPELFQSLLADRFKLRVHRETREMPRYALVRARKDGTLGPRLRPSSTDCQATPGKCSLTLLPGHVTGGHVNMDTVRAVLVGSVERVLVDQTGLDGWFELDLEWSPDQTASDKPSIFAAVQEQLGLKLESQRGPVDVIVVDHIERPTED